jgi:hypothetical protein
MKAGAGFVLDGVRVVLQVVNMVLHAGVFVLQLLDLLLELFVFHALLFVGSDAVLTDDDVVSQKDCQRHCGSRGDAAAHAVEESGGADEVRALYDLFHSCVSAFSSASMRGMKVAPIFVIGDFVDSRYPTAHDHASPRLAGTFGVLLTLSSKFFFHFRRQAEVALYQ